MYTNCLRCDGSLGRNSEIPHLQVGGRIAFAEATGRVWVICPACEQWNLVPISERWEIVAECRQLAASAEVRSKGKVVGFARTTDGLDLLSLDGHGAVDIANWRYGRRLQRRQSSWRSRAFAFLALAAIGGLAAAFGSSSLALGIYVTAALTAWLLTVWRKPPRLSVLVRTQSGKVRIWFWQLFDIVVDTGPTGTVGIIRCGQQLRGDEAAAFLSGFLTQINGPDCIEVSINQAVQRVAGAEETSAREFQEGRGRSRRKKGGPAQSNGSPRRPWEIIALLAAGKSVAAVDPEVRVALEMATTEAVEQRAMASRAEILEDSAAEEKEVAAIADDLLLPEDVQRDFSALIQHRGDKEREPDK